ncbi:FCD domain-containing protein [Streptomyces sp. NPDC001508]|uniref:FadR/GntR family transcriptional regulator n=1 Tax=Streptomyces sp. NPDC001508 TaxID=3154656 RepID=UPI003322E095
MRSLESPEGGEASRDDGYTPGYVRAARQILSLIERDGLSPGDRLPAENELARTLGFSHTVTREAVKVLSAVGKISAQKGRGLYVANDPVMFHDVEPRYIPLDVEDVTALFEYRRLLEAELAEFAAARATPSEMRAIKEALDAYWAALERNEFTANAEADEAFHAAVADAAHNKFLRASAANVRGLVSQSAAMVLQHVIAGRHHDAAREHQAIYDAIQHGDGPAARTAAVAHIDRTLVDVRKEILRRVSGHPAE